MTIEEHLDLVSGMVNDRMHPGSRCPGAGALGECAAISEMSKGFYIAHLYLWPAAMDLQPATVAAWFTAAFCSNVIVSAVLHDPDNNTIDGVTDEGVWPWEVLFSLQGEHAEEPAE